jgi:hypothetical protein
MWSYVAYGLYIESAFPLPELVPATDAPAQGTVRMGTPDLLSFPPSDLADGNDTRTDEIRLTYPGVGSFLVRDGCQIVVERSDGVPDEVVRLFLLGPALGVLLRQRGYLTLHASAVAIQGQAVVFLGHKGCGKSTMAAALHARGHAVVADDIVAVRMEQERAVVYPGFPRLKLWPEALSALGEDAQTLSRLHPEWEKRSRPVVDSFYRRPLSLGRLYVLADGNEPVVESPTPQSCLMELVRHAYAPGSLQTTDIAAVHLRQCGELVNRIPVRRLRRPRSLAGLPSLACLVEEDVAARQNGAQAAAKERYRTG